MVVQLGGRLATRGDAPLGDRCPIDRTLQAVGNRTALLLVREVLYGATRFESLVKRVGVTDAVASQRLKELVAAGVLAKQPYREPGQRTRHEYVLTPAGHELAPVLLTLLEWGVRHRPDGRGRLGVTHAGCGAEVHVALRCAAGHDVPEEQLLVTGDAAV
ncbi:helix-turn-helix domain-containing protein [Nocardioides panacisoli]|uniref:Helix-turn-helix domain-containing protein n=1 Tax=Nocardioides panacisoli TaxID=627624 RepID=A0ABP7J537_9ACTN